MAIVFVMSEAESSTSVIGRILKRLTELKELAKSPQDAKAHTAGQGEIGKLVQKLETLRDSVAPDTFAAAESLAHAVRGEWDAVVATVRAKAAELGNRFVDEKSRDELVRRGNAALATNAHKLSELKQELMNEEGRTAFAGRFKDAIKEKMEQGKELLREGTKFLKSRTDGKAVTDAVQKGESMLNALSMRVLQVRGLQAIIKRRVKGIKHRLKNAVLAEVEGGVTDLYKLQTAAVTVKGSRRFTGQEKLIPTLFVPTNVALSHAYIVLLYIMHVPFYIAIVIALLEEQSTCYFGDALDGLASKGSFENSFRFAYIIKISLMTVFLVLNTVCYYWVRSIKSLDANMHEDGKDDDNNTGDDLELAEFAPKCQLTTIARKAEQQLILMEAADAFYDSWTKVFRDAFTIVVDVWDFLICQLTIVYIQSTNSDDLCKKNAFFLITKANFVVLLTSLFIRLILALTQCINFMMEKCSCCHSMIRKQAIKMDQRIGTRAAEWFVDKILFRPRMKMGTHRKAAEEYKHRKAKFRRRRQLLKQLNKLNEELGIEQDFRSALGAASGMSAAEIKAGFENFETEATNISRQGVATLRSLASQGKRALDDFSTSLRRSQNGSSDAKGGDLELPDSVRGPGDEADDTAVLIASETKKAQ